ncbi:MAG: alkaline phosphatase [Ramlibacter sp.]|jgi:Ca2+-binding RTX toxin-like protein|nr:alkaline phosphatase [Ramlibacter sp.]
MAAHALADVSGTVLAGFDPVTDTLLVPAGLSPASLTLLAADVDTIVSIGGYSVTLAGIAPGSLDGTQFVFGDGTLWRQGSGSDDDFVGTVGADTFDLRAGGADTVDSGDGNDVIDLGATLDTADSINGEGGQDDVVRLAGNYAETVVLGDTTIRGVENFILGTGGTIRLQLSGGLLSTATPSDYESVLFDATSQTAADAVYLDGRLALKAFEALMGAGDDTVLGGARNDTLDGGAGANLMAGCAGDDRLEAGSLGSSTLLGGAGNDALSVTSGSLGTSGVVMAGGSGSDTLTGGEGNDELRAAGWQDAVDEAVTDEDWATSRLDGRGGHDILWGDVGRDTLIGGFGDDTLRGGGSQDSLEGGAGDDSLSGGGGADHLDGGTGWDVLDGGAGDDWYEVNDSAQRIVEAAGGGYDTVVVYTNDYTLGEHVEYARLEGDGSNAGGRLVGNGQDNLLVAWDGADTLEGGAGDDTLNAGWGEDQLVGGDGDDEYHVSTVDVVVEGANGGVDTVFVAGASYVLPTEIENATVDGYGGELVGNAKDNVLVADGFNTLILGRGGDDRLEAGGSDTLVGGAGDDTYVLSGNGLVREGVGEGTDTVISSSYYPVNLADNIENLTLAGTTAEGYGNALDNVIRGNNAANQLGGRAGADTLIGGRGNDRYHVSDADDVVVEVGGEGTDVVETSMDFSLGANVENLQLFHYYGEDVVGLRGTGNALDNVLTSTTGGNDTLNGGAGADTMRGGDGNDLYMVDNAGDQVEEDYWEGTDTVRATVDFTLGVNIETLVLAAGSAASTGRGNARDNRLVGNANDNTLFGEDGDDTLDGGSGNDSLAGGAGSDTYFVDSAGDRVVEVASGWYGDTVVSTAAVYRLDAYVENLNLAGDGNLRGVGNAMANNLKGNAGNNRLDGGEGADALAGGLGNDSYVVDNAGDRVTETGAGGTDTVFASIAYTLGSWQEHLTLTGTGAIAGTGNALANRLRGNAAANLLDGGLGADTLSGGLGDDTYVVNAAGDVVSEGADGGVDTILASVTRVLGNHQENLTLTGGLDIDGHGNALANVLQGNQAANKLDGGAGADTMEGGAGSDVYVVDDAGDVVSELASYGGRDTVIASVDYTLGNYVENLRLAGNAVAGFGNDAPNAMEGNDRGNLLDGGASNDTIQGGEGNDALVGGINADDLFGGAGSDRFVFRSTEESNLSAYDLVMDFASGEDRIDVSQIDGDLGTAGLQALRFVGAQIGGATGELWYEQIDGGIVLAANTDADARAEFVVVFVGVFALDIADFIL